MKGPYGKDVDFRASCIARDHTGDYWMVKRAQWIGDLSGERREYGKHGNKTIGFWNSASLRIQDEIVGKKKGIEKLDNPENYAPTVAQNLQSTTPSPDTKKIQYNGSEICIPSVAFEGGKKRKDVHVMKNFKGGNQIYLPMFSPHGVTILRGGTWKSPASGGGCNSGSRLKSGGYGKYSDWGFRVALSADHCHSEKNGEYPPTLTVPINEGTSMEMVYIKPGKFTMGGESTKDDKFSCIEVPKHEVELTEGYYIGKYPVTQCQYKEIMGKNPSGSTKGPNCPVDSISEDDALDFCGKFTDATDVCIRLPTEAEWEYAARAGSDSKWFFGDDPSILVEYAWIKENSGGKSHNVGEKKPNPFGLYDVYGNVCERVADKYEKNYYKNCPSKDPDGPSPGTSSNLKYKVKIERPGDYNLSLEVCTVNYNQQMTVSVNEADSQDIELPFTCGDWKKTDPIVLSLEKGESVLHFWRACPPQYGMAISNIRLNLAGDSLATS